MEIKLREKPTGVTIIEGFPGLGLIGTITTEYLIKNLKAKSIGYIRMDDIAPIAAIHSGTVIQPLEVYYVKKKNLIILHSLFDPSGIEWKVADALSQFYKELKAKEIISIEGIMSGQRNKKVKAYYFSSKSSQAKKLKSSGAEELKEGILMGITAALLLENQGMNNSGVFVETHSKLPDSRASAKIIEVLDGYLGLGIDSAPLEKAAADFEKKLKDYMGNLQKTQEQIEERSPEKPRAADYMG
tara:strand:- start:8606 stop:9334 length:729 start_codon:yes stop_codon:yes gene_type:complete